MNKTACVIIWYNPSLAEVQNVLTYNSFFTKIYIVDNSDIDNRELSEKITNSIYISNGKNLGIAEALNIGCSAAYNEDFEYCMTMDQDSVWDVNNLRSYLDEIDCNLSDSTALYAPSMHVSDDSFSIIGDIKRIFIKQKNTADKVFVENVITSGNVINLKIWNKIGKFDEKLFIDEVDFEFCFRLISAGYKILKFNNIYFNHTLGEPKKSFFPMTYSYHGKRCYYISRNKHYVISKYPFFARKYNYSLILKLFLIGKLFTLQFSDAKYIVQGKKDFKRSIFGEYSK